MGSKVWVWGAVAFQLSMGYVVAIISIIAALMKKGSSKASKANYNKVQGAL